MCLKCQSKLREGEDLSLLLMAEFRSLQPAERLCSVRQQFCLTSDSLREPQNKTGKKSGERKKSLVQVTIHTFFSLILFFSLSFFFAPRLRVLKWSEESVQQIKSSSPL